MAVKALTSSYNCQYEVIKQKLDQDQIIKGELLQSFLKHLCHFLSFPPCIGICKEPYILQFNTTSKMNSHFILLFLYFRNLYFQNACLHAQHSLRHLLERLDSIMSVQRKSQVFLVMECTSKLMFMLRSLRYNHQQEIMRSTDVQEDCICIFCACTHMRESMFSQKVCVPCTLILCKYTCHIYSFRTVCQVLFNSLMIFK